MVCNYIIHYDISIHYSIFHIMVTVPYRSERADVLHSLAPWSDLPI